MLRPRLRALTKELIHRQCNNGVAARLSNGPVAEGGGVLDAETQGEAAGAVDL